VDDCELLRRFASERSEAAMAALVERHMKMVYATARREVGDDTLAEDVTLAVFMILARKANRLSASVMLSSWLFTVTRYAARNAVRGERRRLSRETKAIEEMTREIGYQEAEAWDRVSPELNDALDALNSREREAIFLRYFRDLSIEEAGQELRISPKAAQMRIQRATEKLRSRLAAKGAPVTVAILAALLLKRSAEASPALSAQEISRQALEPAHSLGTSSPAVLSRGAAILPIVQGTLRTMTLRTATLAAAITLAVLAGAGGLAAAHRNALENAHIMAETVPVNALASSSTQVFTELSIVVVSRQELSPYLRTPVPAGAAFAANYDPIATASSAQVGRMLTDFKARGLVNLLPKVTTLSGVPASIEFSGANLVKALPEINSLNIKVTPRINSNGTVTLPVSVKLGSTIGTSRLLSTTRTVRDGETFAGAEAIPADATATSKVLLVLVTPHIIAAK